MQKNRRSYYKPPPPQENLAQENHELPKNQGHHHQEAPIPTPHKEPANNGAPCPLLLNLSTLYLTGKEFSHNHLDSIKDSQTNLLELQYALSALNKSTNLKESNSLEVKSFIIHGIEEALHFMGDGIQLQIQQNDGFNNNRNNNLLGKTTHQILLYMEKKVLKWNIDVSSLLTCFKEYLIILENCHYNHHHLYPSLNIIYWQDNVALFTNHGGQFTFCRTDPSNQTVLTLLYENFSKLRYFTTPQKLAEILVHATTGEGITLRGDRNTSNKADVCPQGLVYCSVDLSLMEEEVQVNNEHAIQNRYGSVVMHFSLSDIVKKGGENSTKFYKLGTKQYSKEFCQLLLLSDRVEKEWWIVQEGAGCGGGVDEVIAPSPSKRPRTEEDEDGEDVSESPPLLKQKPIMKLSPLDILEFEWNLRYCDSSDCGNNCWTHPQIVVEGELKLALIDFKIVFEYEHKCENCVECEIRRNGGRCFVQMERDGGRWAEEGGAKYRDYDLPIILFAESVPIQAREKIIGLQSEYKIFEVDQFDIIQHYWEEHGDLCVMAWSTTCPS